MIFPLKPQELKELPQVEILYSPTERLPTKHEYLPTIYIKRPTTYKNEENILNSPSYPNNNQITLPLSPHRQKEDLFNDQVEIQNLIPDTYSNNSPGNNNNNNLIFGNQNVIDLQNELIKTKEDNKTLKLETNKLKNQIQQLNNKIKIINEENMKLRNNNDENPFDSDNEMHEKTKLKQEIERLSNELINVKNHELEQYKKIQEDESKIDNLLQKINSLQKENDYLKRENQKLLHTSNMTQNQNTFLINKNKNLENKLNQENDLEVVIKGELIENNEELELLTQKICKNNKKMILNILYKASIDSDKAQAFHDKCDNAKNTIILVKSGDGKRFGGFTSCDWKGHQIEKNDRNAFVFSFDRMQIYDIIPGQGAIICCQDYGAIFSGQQILIYDDAFTKGGTTCERSRNYNTNEDYELTGGYGQFEIKEIEVYEVDLE